MNERKIRPEAKKFTPEKPSNSDARFTIVLSSEMMEELERRAEEFGMKKTELTRQMIDHCLQDLAEEEMGV